MENTYTYQGWQCPICKHVFSPSVSVCLYCPAKIITTTSCEDVELVITEHNYILVSNRSRNPEFDDEKPCKGVE